MAVSTAPKWLVSALLALATGFPVKVLANDQRATVNYMIHCQGCHLPQAVGHPGKVPRMNQFLGFFLHSRAGREYVLQVPGVATSALPDDELAEVMNWLLLVYSKPQLPKDFTPYTAAEVARHRAQLEPDPAARRAEVLAQIAAADRALGAKIEAASSDAGSH